MMKSRFVALSMCAALTLFSGAASAKGCLKGAAVGGVAGHVAGHHGVLGAAAGCAVGHHRAAKQAREQRAANTQDKRTGNSRQDWVAAARHDRTSNGSTSSGR